MSEPDGKPTDNLPAPYRVGYKRPPREHRFRKGQSGNPAGRPKGSKNQPKVNHGYGMRAAEEYLRQEAYRPVTIREGEQFVELPAIQAVFRAMGVAAMKGNRFAQKTMAELVTTLEEREAQSRLELFSSAFDYKHQWTQEIERCKAHGLPIPEPVPHPDDMILNPNNGEVRIEGPKTKEQKDFYNTAIARRAEAQEEVTAFAEEYRNAVTDKAKAMWLEEWHFEQRIFDIINDALAPRYKVRLVDRSFAVGASREGQTLKEFAEDRKKAPHKRRWNDYVEE